MARLTKAQLQEKLDVEKWNDSQDKGVDTCGEYEYCKFCVKTAENPCATAYNKAQKPATAKTAKKTAKVAKN